MRLLSRHAPVDELDSPPPKRQADPTEVPLKAQKLLGEKPRLIYNVEKVVVRPHDHDGMAIPPKAQRLLGEKGRVRFNGSHDMKHPDPDSFWNIRNAEQKSLGTFPRSEADSDTIPGAKKGAPLPYVPVPMRPSDDFSAGSTPRTGTSTTYPGHQPSIESMRREYYDASKQPLYVSQQTSESSVRDMALHRGALPIPETSSETDLIALPSMNSLKHQRPEQHRTASDEPKKARKMDLTALFPHPKTSAGIVSSGKLLRSPLAKNDSGFFPKETVHAQVARRGSKLRLETDQNTKPLPKQPADSTQERAKVFESHIYDNKKTHVHRPPKGVKNWFDGLDISSDEEEPEPVSSPAVELPANEIPRIREALPSVFSPYGPPVREFTAPHHGRSESYTEDTVLPSRSSREAMRRRMRIRNSRNSNAAEASSPRGMEDRRQGGESRLAHSRLGSHSVLSLSSESAGEETLSPTVRARDTIGNDEAVTLEKAAPLELQRPLAPPRKLDGFTREAQVSRVDSARQQSQPAQDKLIDVESSPRGVSRGNGSVLSDSSAAARRKIRGVHGTPAQSPPSKRPTHSSYERDGARSAGADTNSSSIPTDASRMMAVTEEEMILLELMRQKRAAMQKDSFTEGYRVALQEEGRYSAQGQESMHDHALMSLGKKDRAGVRSRGSSKAGSLFKEEKQQRRRMSDIRKEEVDKSFKMGRFLAMETPDGDRPPKIERFLEMAPGLSGEFGGRPISGTEIEIESGCDDIEETEDDLLSSCEEKEDDEDKDDQFSAQKDEPRGEELASTLDHEELQTEDTKTPKQTHNFSPMQRLTDQVRGLSTEDPLPTGGLDEDHYEEVAAYLESSHETEQDHEDVSNAPNDNNELEWTKQNESGELLSPTVYTPMLEHFANSKPPSLDPIKIDTEGLSVGNDVVHVDSPDTPVATNWARTSSLKHPRPQRQQAVLDFTPLDTQVAQPASPSVATNLSSPVTSTFRSITVSPDQTVIPSADSHDASVTDETRDQASPIPHPLKSHPLSPAIDRKSSKKDVPPVIDTSGVKSQGRITSMASITSAGEDVLAAWAELGGSDNLAFKRKRTR